MGGGRRLGADTVVVCDRGVYEGVLRDRLPALRERVARAAEQGGRSAEDVMVVAVSKGHPAEAVVAAWHLGLREFGENRVEEAEPKMARVQALLGEEPRGGEIHWHMVGHVQSRKAARAIGPYTLIHSVDRLKLARRLERFAAQADCVQPILLEVNVAADPNKYGFTPQAVEEVVPAILALPHLRVEGLMTMAPLVTDPEEVRPVFAALRRLRDRLQEQYPEISWHHLSMGMSNDFEVAIQEGATIIRVGTAIFGPREGD